MVWADAVPNLLIGLREGLEAGLVISILLAALRRLPAKDGEHPSSAPIWLGLIGALSLSISFAAILTFSTDVLSGSAQDVVAGLLSVIAVVLVTVMIFWMRRTAASLSGQLRGEVAAAMSLGAGALALTAFFAVGREGLETTLFLWTAAKASGHAAEPILGAAVGIAISVLLCWLLYRQAVRLNLGVFFSRTAILLIVIAAGVLSYGLGDLQTAGWLPGAHWIAFDLSAHIDSSSWWAAIVTGITNLTPKMTVLQVTAWAVYLVVVLALFLRPQAAPTPAAARVGDEHSATWLEKLAGRRLWATAATLVLVPAVIAAIVIAALPSAKTSRTDVTLTKTSCAKSWRSAHSGKQTISVENKSGKAAEINVVNASGAVIAEIETLGPATTADMPVTLTEGSYTIKCLLPGQKMLRSATVSVSGGSDLAAPPAVKRITVDALQSPNEQYIEYASGALNTLAGLVNTVRGDLAGGNVDAARTDWLPAYLAWERVGASYNSFGDAGVAVAGLPDGLPDGPNDPGFTGLHRLEYGLWHGQSAAELLPVADRLVADIAALRRDLPTDDVAGDVTALPLRSHEILEDALRDHLSGIDDQGSNAAFPATYADIAVTRSVLAILAPLVNAQRPDLIATANQKLDALAAALDSVQAGSPSQFVPFNQATLEQRQRINGAIGDALQTLAGVPPLLDTKTPQ